MLIDLLIVIAGTFILVASEDRRWAIAAKYVWQNQKGIYHA